MEWPAAGAGRFGPGPDPRGPGAGSRRGTCAGRGFEQAELAFAHRFVPGTSPAPRLVLSGTRGTEGHQRPLARGLSPGAGVNSPRHPSLQDGMPRCFRRLAVGGFDDAGRPVPIPAHGHEPYAHRARVESRAQRLRRAGAAVGVRRQPVGHELARDEWNAVCGRCRGHVR